MQTKKSQFTFSSYWEHFGTVSILLLIIILFGSLQPQAFLSGNNLVQILIQSSITILIAGGEFFAILLAGIDLSVGSTMAFTGAVCAKLMTMGIHPLWAALLGCVVLGMLLGLMNGALVNFTGLHPFVITLGTLAIFRGFTYVISNARAINANPIFSRGIGGSLIGIPVPVIISLATMALLTFFTLKCKAGRNMYAIGGNAKAAWFSGINVHWHVLLGFILSGVCAGLAGMVDVARLGAAEPNAGTGFETYAIAACVIGGSSLFGGKGAIPKALVGGLIIGVINNGLNMLGVSSYYQQICMGVLIIAAVTLDRFFGASRNAVKA